MQYVTLLKGAPASGKSTFAKSLVRSNLGWKRINNDQLRLAIDFGHWSKDNEKLIKWARQELLHKFLMEGHHVVVDNVNAGKQHMDEVNKIVESLNIDCTVGEKPIYCELDVAIARDAERCEQERVGADIVRKWWRKLGGESFKEYAPREIIFQKKEYKVEQTPELPRAILCDLDGTLCHANGRNVYDASTSDQDTPDLHVIRAVYSSWLAGAHVIFMSGRPDEYMGLTVKFLQNAFAGLALGYELYMRKTGDNRRDCDVKEELFRENVLGKYYVDYVFDDRKQVVDRWRAMGLKCFQVQEGNF